MNESIPGSIDFTDKTVLITGGTGSFGRQFLRRMLEDNQLSRLVVFSRDEQKQYEMAAQFGDASLRYFIGDVRDLERLEMAMPFTPPRSSMSRRPNTIPSSASRRMFMAPRMS